MLSKESKIRVLETFYGIDYVFFGKNVKEVVNCCPIVKEEYLSLKGALLSVYVEMLKVMDHKPAVLKEKVSSKRLVKMARESAKAAREASKRIVKTEQARRDIISEMKETFKKDKSVNVSKLVETKIREKAFRLAIDNLMVARSLLEAKDLKSMNDFTGKIIEDSYKILRDNLCETAMIILDNGTDE